MIDIHYRFLNACLKNKKLVFFFFFYNFILMFRIIILAESTSNNISKNYSFLYTWLKKIKERKSGLYINQALKELNFLKF